MIDTETLENQIPRKLSRQHQRGYERSCLVDPVVNRCLQLYPEEIDQLKAAVACLHILNKRLMKEIMELRRTMPNSVRSEKWCTTGQPYPYKPHDGWKRRS